jgi:hypothetical protein
MKFVKSKDIDWQEKKGYSKKVFLNEEDLKTPGALVQQIRIKPQEEAALHYHKK